MAKFTKAPKGPSLDTDEGAPTLGKSKAKTILEDGSVRGKKLTTKQRGLFGAIAGGAKLKAKKAAPPSGGGGGGGGGRGGYGTPPAMSMGPRGAGNMEADTKKYGAMRGRK